MANYSKSQLAQMLDELLELQPAHERYLELQAEIKTGLQKFSDPSVVSEKGRAFLSISERIVIHPAIAISVLGERVADKVIQVKKSVSNKLVDAFVQAGEIDHQLYNQLIEQAERKPAVSLYIRPLK